MTYLYYFHDRMQEWPIEKVKLTTHTHTHMHAHSHTQAHTHTHTHVHTSLSCYSVKYTLWMFIVAYIWTNQVQFHVLPIALACTEGGYLTYFRSGFNFNVACWLPNFTWSITFNEVSHFYAFAFRFINFLMGDLDQSAKSCWHQKDETECCVLEKRCY